MKIGSFVAVLLVLLLQLFGIAETLSSVSPAASSISKGKNKQKKAVALIGTTGQLGRETVSQLSRAGYSVKCLLRHNLTGVKVPPPATLNAATTPIEVAAYLATLPNVEFVTGDINDHATLVQLVRDTDACLAVHGAGPPRPPIRSLFLPNLLFPETDPTHAKQVNYVGIQRLLVTMNASPTCRHLVRITGNGESPWSIFSILINAFGGMAKAWNYEAEQLIRNQTTIDYTIIRPGIMKQQQDNNDTSVVPTASTLALRDNGGTLPVTVTTYGKIAALAIECLERPNLKRSTLATMMMKTNGTHDAVNTAAGAAVVPTQTVDEVRPDTRVFPTSLLSEHRRATRTGGLMIMTVTLTFFVGFVSLLLHWLGL